MVDKMIITAVLNDRSKMSYWDRVFMDIFHYYLNIRDWIIDLIKRRKLSKKLKQISLTVAKIYGIENRNDIKELRKEATVSYNLIKAKNMYDHKTIIALTKADVQCYVIRNIYKIKKRGSDENRVYYSDITLCNKYFNYILWQGLLPY